MLEKWKRKKRLENMSLGHRLRTTTGNLSWVPPITKEIINNNILVLLCLVYHDEAYLLQDATNLLLAWKWKKLIWNESKRTLLQKLCYKFRKVLLEDLQSKTKSYWTKRQEVLQSAKITTKSSSTTYFRPTFFSCRKQSNDLD